METRDFYEGASKPLAQPFAPMGSNGIGHPVREKHAIPSSQSAFPKRTADIGRGYGGLSAGLYHSVRPKNHLKSCP